MAAYHEYLKTEAWAKLRKKAMQRAGFRCQLCNSKSHLQVHHRVYPKIYGTEKLNDLTTLCRDCHELFTFKGQGEPKTDRIDSIADMVCPLLPSNPTQAEIKRRREQSKRDRTLARRRRR